MTYPPRISDENVPSFSSVRRRCVSQRGPASGDYPKGGRGARAGPTKAKASCARPLSSESRFDRPRSLFREPKFKPLVQGNRDWYILKDWKQGSLPQRAHQIVLKLLHTTQISDDTGRRHAQPEVVTMGAVLPDRVVCLRLSRNCGVPTLGFSGKDKFDEVADDRTSGYLAA